jgi:hypothetical protein
MGGRIMVPAVNLDQFMVADRDTFEREAAGTSSGSSDDQ